ncbi:hypothetical protein ACFYY5_29205 [Nocardia elegans]|uniref:Uncharacterized protein n=1 Tax=Nocardia elegans TaxID=300029 RepID=A0ABW6TPQ1_9NOCA
MNSNEPRDQLAEILRDETPPIHAAASRALEKMYAEWGTTPGLPTPAVAMHRMADLLDEEGWRPPPRVITDPAELDRMPYMSVVLAYGVAHQAVPDEHGVDPVWLKPTGSSARTSLELLADARGKGVIVLYEPVDDDG